MLADDGAGVDGVAGVAGGGGGGGGGGWGGGEVWEVGDGCSISRHRFRKSFPAGGFGGGTGTCELPCGSFCCCTTGCSGARGGGGCDGGEGGEGAPGMAGAASLPASHEQFKSGDCRS